MGYNEQYYCIHLNTWFLMAKNIMIRYTSTHFQINSMLLNPSGMLDLQLAYYFRNPTKLECINKIIVLLGISFIS